MAAKNTAQLLFDISKAGNKTHFLSFVKHSSILTMSPDYALPRDISLLIISFATIKITDEFYWKTLETYFHFKKEDMNAHDIANCVWGFAKSPKPLQNSTWKSLETEVNKNILQFTAKELSNICYSFAAQENFAPILWDRLKFATIRQINEMVGYDIPSLIWSFSKANILDDKLWTLFEKKVILEIKNITPDILGSVMYGFAKQSKGSEQLWNLFENVTQNRITEFESRTIMNVICSFNKMGRGKESFWQDIINKLQNDLKNFPVAIAINSICALGREPHKKLNLQKLIEDSFNSDERIQQMTYGNIVNLVKLLMTEKITKHEMWDKLAMRLRTQIPEVSFFNLRIYSYFMAVNPAYWNFVCEESILAYFDKIGKGNIKPKEEIHLLSNIEEIIDISWLCLYNKVGSYFYWKELTRFLQSKNFKIEDIAPSSVSKFMQLVARRLLDSDQLQSKWLTFEDELYRNPLLFNRFANDPKAMTILLQACFSVNKQEKMLERFEKVYASLTYKPKELADFIFKAKTEKSSFKECRIHKFITKSEFMGLEPEKQIELFKGVCESWFNNYLGKQYPLPPFYKEVIQRIPLKKLREGQKVQEEENEPGELVEEVIVAPEVLGQELQELTLELEKPLETLETHLSQDYTTNNLSSDEERIL